MRRRRKYPHSAGGGHSSARPGGAAACQGASGPREDLFSDGGLDLVAGHGGWLPLGPEADLRQPASCGGAERHSAALGGLWAAPGAYGRPRFIVASHIAGGRDQEQGPPITLATGYGETPPGKWATAHRIGATRPGLLWRSAAAATAAAGRQRRYGEPAAPTCPPEGHGYPGPCFRMRLHYRGIPAPWPVLVRLAAVRQSHTESPTRQEPLRWQRCLRRWAWGSSARRRQRQHAAGGEAAPGRRRPRRQPIRRHIAEGGIARFRGSSWRRYGEFVALEAGLLATFGQASGLTTAALALAALAALSATFGSYRFHSSLTRP